MRNNRDRRNRQGATVVEVGILLPIFLLILFAIMDISRLYWTQNVVRGAAYEGARIAILVEATDDQVQSTILDELVSGGLNVTPNTAIGSRESKQPVDVTVSVPFSFMVLGKLIPSLDGTRNISATAVMTHEG